MDTQTLIESIGELTANNDTTRRKMLLNIYSVYSQPFSRLVVLSTFEVPAQLIWHQDTEIKTEKVNNIEIDKKVKTDYFSIDRTVYRPKTIADFVSVIAALSRYRLTPKWDDKGVASILWNRNRNNRED